MDLEYLRIDEEEPEIIEFMTQRKISILGIADTRKKGTGTKVIDANYVLIWSGVCKEKRAVHGVGFIIQHDKPKNLVSTEFISERLLKISIREDNKINHYIHVMTPTQMRIRTPSKNSLTPSTTSRNKMTCTSCGVSTAEWEREERHGTQ